MVYIEFEYADALSNWEWGMAKAKLYGFKC